jgi:xanthine dehydrogenase YagR molybdenum-binding subunit
MIFGKMVRSPYAHARVVSVDLSAAEKAPGVKAVLAYVQPGAQVMYQGDPVAAVAADTEERSLDAARMIRVRYEVLPHFANVEQAMAPDAPAVFPNGNTRQGSAEETGDLAAGFAKAAHVVEATYSTHVIGHVCLETHGTVCEWDGDKLTAWISTQAVIQSAQGFAQGLGIPQANTWAAASAASSRPTRRASSAPSWRASPSCR